MWGFIAVWAATLVIVVDHADPANQQPAAGRLFEYTDFFSRSVRVHQGDTLDFNFQGFHILGVARTEELAQRLQPLARPDRHDPPSIATGKPKTSINPIVFGPGSGCGWSAPCTYTGGNDLKISGPPQGSEWRAGGAHHDPGPERRRIAAAVRAGPEPGVTG